MSRSSTTISERRIFVVAGEASGDRLAAHVLRDANVAAFGMGGDALRGAGADIRVDLRALSSMGVLDVVPNLLKLARAVSVLGSSVQSRRPDRALLVDYTELNARVGRWLRQKGVPVVWLVAPQVWAWRPHRITALARSMDHLGALFSFEIERWRSAGVDARWVGHPAVEDAIAARCASPDASLFHRLSLSLSGGVVALALLPGSRRSEVLRHLPIMLESAASVSRHDRIHPVVLLAHSLEPTTRQWAVEQSERMGASVVDVHGQQGLAGPLRLLRDLGARAALCTSGTATLECALAGVSPVILYRTDPLTASIGRALLNVDAIGLPNVVLGRRVFTELLQDHVAVHEIEKALGNAFKRSDSRDSIASELQHCLTPNDGMTFAERVQAMLLS
ncbi:MAG: hypothetical protein U0165_10710 [Polyangiaceae bacterium]